MEKALPHILQSSAEKLKVHNTELFKTEICLLPLNLAKCGADNQQLNGQILKRNENFKRSGIKARSSKKPVSALQL